MCVCVHKIMLKVDSLMYDRVRPMLPFSTLPFSLELSGMQAQLLSKQSEIKRLKSSNAALEAKAAKVWSQWSMGFDVWSGVEDEGDHGLCALSIVPLSCSHLA